MIDFRFGLDWSDFNWVRLDSNTLILGKEPHNHKRKEQVMFQSTHQENEKFLSNGKPIT